MTNGLAAYWWVLLVRGVAAALFGILTLIWPTVTLRVLVLLFGAYAFINGIFAEYVGTRARIDGKRWWMMILAGLVSIVIGVLTFIWPKVTALALLYLIAAWAIITGVFELTAAIWLRKTIKGEWLLALCGILSLLFGMLLAILPGPGALAIIWLIGIYAIIFGVLLIIAAFWLWSLGNKFNKFEREILAEN